MEYSSNEDAINKGNLPNTSTDNLIKTKIINSEFAPKKILYFPMKRQIWNNLN